MGITASLHGFEAASEFSTPEFHNDTCGEDGFAMIEHVKDGCELTGDAIAAIRDDMAANGYKVQGGTTMSELVDYFNKHRNLGAQEVCPYGTDVNTIHQALLAHAGRDGVILQVNDAQMLTGNEGGVHSHFVAIGGIHPVLGYLVGNGDDVRALAQNGGHGKIIPCRWMSWWIVQRAQPVAVAVVPGLPWSPSIPGQP